MRLVVIRLVVAVWVMVDHNRDLYHHDHYSYQHERRGANTFNVACERCTMSSYFSSN